MVNKTVATSSTALPLAGLGRRIGALFYEALILSALILILGALFQFVFPNVANHRFLRFSFFAYEIILTFIYFNFCWSKGQTLAMKTWRIRLCRVDNQPITIRQAIVRYSLIFITLFPLIPVYVMVKHQALPPYAVWIASIWAMAPYLWALKDRESQFLHDAVLGTRLIFVAPTQH